MTKQKTTSHGLATYVTPDFRMYEPETVKGTGGIQVRMRLCETLEGERWEGFYSYVDGRSVNRTRRAMGKRVNNNA